MTPEQLKKGKELAEEIKLSESPFSKIKAPEKAFGHKGVTLTNPNNSNGNVYFRLKPDQIEIVKVLVLSMAEQNFKELKKIFNEL